MEKRMGLIESLKNQAKKVTKTVVLPEGSEPRTVKAASIISAEKIANVILVGNRDQINSVASEQNVTTEGITISGIAS